MGAFVEDAEDFDPDAMADAVGHRLLNASLLLRGGRCHSDGDPPKSRVARDSQGWPSIGRFDGFDFPLSLGNRANAREIPSIGLPYPVDRWDADAGGEVRPKLLRKTSVTIPVVQVCKHRIRAGRQLGWVPVVVAWGPGPAIAHSAPAPRASQSPSRNGREISKKM